MTNPAVTNPFTEWLHTRRGHCLVAGPCSVETPEQILGTALALPRDEVMLLRGGIWKPRTRPGSFEGVGAPGLPWLKQAGQTAGLPVTTEVASAEHVELCLRAGIDVLWVGARTTTSPMAVQEIANALAGVDVPVLVKNPMNPDLALWIGAIERLHRAGVRRIVAVHRGFSTHLRRRYRNQPLWSIPLALRQRLPQLPILSDPSHIGGAREYVSVLAREALACGFDGWMIECHWRPAEAQSDASQQLTPPQLERLTAQLRETCAATSGSRQSPLEVRLREVEEDLSLLQARRQELIGELKQQMEPPQPCFKES